MTLDLDQFVLMADLSKYNEESDFVEMDKGGIKVVCIRINEDDGSLRLDPCFLHNWQKAKQAKRKRCIYLVVNPAKVSYLSYLNWLEANLPPDCHVIALDIEISRLYCDATPVEWGKALAALINGTLAHKGLLAMGFEILPYSNSGFFANVKPWPKQLKQWWARYLYSMYPTAVIKGKLTAIHVEIEWGPLRAKLAALNWTPLTPDLTEAQTGDIVAWQVASSYINPACQRGCPMDITLLKKAYFDAHFAGQEDEDEPDSGEAPQPEGGEVRYLVTNCYVAAVHDGPGKTYTAVDYFIVRDPNTGLFQDPTYVTVYGERNGFSAITPLKPDGTADEWIGASLLAKVAA